MPLIVMTGIPCSGKTTRTNQLKEYFEKRNKKCEIVSETDTIIKAGYDVNTFFVDSKKEKAVRADIKSIAQRLLNTSDVLIIDGSNYIKGCRYEIYCMSKLYKTPQCTVHCELPIEYAWLWNEKRDDGPTKYSREIFDALVMRYESPDSRNRWDHPLFTVLPEDELKCDDIYNALYEAKAPKPNMSTQCPPLSSANYLYDIDRITQEIVNDIIAAKNLGIESDIKIPKYNLTTNYFGNITQLSKLRRQFINYSKMQQTNINQIAPLFVQYINKSG